MKDEVDKLDINKLVKGLSGLNNLKKNIDKLDVGNLETGPKDLTNLRDLMDKEVVIKTVYNTPDTKVNSLAKKIPDALLWFREINTTQTKRICKKSRDVEKKIPDISGLVTTTILNTKIGGIGNIFLILVV